MKNDLTYDDFATLLDALDALDAKFESEFAVGKLMGAMLSPTKDAARQFIEDEDRRRKEKSHVQRRLRETTAILRAKLILARRELDSQQAEAALEAIFEDDEDPE